MQHGVLFISPSAEDANILREMLDPLAVPLQRVASLRATRLRLDRETFGVVLTEAHLPDGSWKEVLDVVEESKLRSAVVVTRPFADARFWADALDLGAYDVLAQPFCCSEVQRILLNALSASRESRKAAHTAL